MHIVKDDFEQYMTLYDKYKEAHEMYMVSQKTDEEVEKAMKSHEEKETVFVGFRTQVHEWVNNADKKLQKQLDSASVRTRSSRHSRHSRHSSHKSCSSVGSYLSAKIQIAELQAQKEMASKSSQIAKENAIRKAQIEQEVAARKAQLAAEQARLDQELEQEKIRAAEATKMVELDTKLAQAIARENILASENGEEPSKLDKLLLPAMSNICLLYTSDAADDRPRV